VIEGIERYLLRTFRLMRNIRVSGEEQDHLEGRENAPWYDWPIPLFTPTHLNML